MSFFGLLALSELVGQRQNGVFVEMQLAGHFTVQCLPVAIMYWWFMDCLFCLQLLSVCMTLVYGSVLLMMLSKFFQC